MMTLDLQRAIAERAKRGETCPLYDPQAILDLLDELERLTAWLHHIADHGEGNGDASAALAGAKAPT